MISHRALWVAGLVNGVGPNPTDASGRFDGNNAKDVYARFDYKIGGMGLDGDNAGRPIPDKNWQDSRASSGRSRAFCDRSSCGAPRPRSPRSCRLVPRSSCT